MAAAKKKQGLVDPKNIAMMKGLSKELGKRFDVAPISLAKGGYVGGAVSLGSLTLDLITGGGLPPGRFTTISGPSMSGKSTVSYQTAANAMDLGIPVFYFDHEASADARYLTALGIDLNEAKGNEDSLFEYFQPSAGESTYKFMHQMLDRLPVANTSSFKVPQAIFIVDSAAAMLPEAEDEDPDKSSMAGPAKVHTWGIRLIKSHLSKKNVSLVMTNQIRMKPGVVYGNPEYEPGGQSMLFYPDLRLQLRGVGKMENERGRGIRGTNAYTAKNKQFPPFINVKDELQLAFGYGFDRFYDGKSYLKHTGQVEFIKGKGGGYKITGMPDYKPLHGKTLKVDDFVIELFKNDFREAVRQQLASGKAHEMFFNVMDYGEMYKFNPENHGIKDGPEGAEEPEEVTEEEALEALAAARLRDEGLNPLDEMNG